MAVVPDSSTPAVAQESSYDWEEFSNSTFSASFAILGQLSGASLEPLTVAIAQKVFSHIPIGSRGEQLLEKAMSGLKANNIPGTTIWIGFGARHILHVLLEKFQLGSCIAFTAALSEGFSLDFTATVLHEFVRIMDVPMDLTPHYSQWQAFVRICQGLLSTCAELGEQINETAGNFGIKVLEAEFQTGDLAAAAPEEVARFLVGMSSVQAEGDLASAAPKQVAKLLLAISRSIIRSLQDTEVKTIDIFGGFTCLWAYVICDVIFGLHVKLCGNFRPGSKRPISLVTCNFELAFEKSQICFVVELLASTSSSYCAKKKLTDREYSLHPGVRPKHISSSQLSSDWQMEVSWRVPFDEVLDCILGEHYALPKGPVAIDSLAAMLGCHVLAHHYSSKSRLHRRHPSPLDLLNRFVSRLPDLKSFSLSAEAFMINLIDQWEVTDESSQIRYDVQEGNTPGNTAEWQEQRIEEETQEESSTESIRSHSSRRNGCKSHGLFDIKRNAYEPLVEHLKQEYLNIRWRIVDADAAPNGASGAIHPDVAEAWYLMVEMASICCDLEVEENLHPTLTGIRLLCRRLVGRAERDPFDFDVNEKYFGKFLITCLELFSCQTSRFRQLPLGHKPSAVSENGIYCYAQYLNDPLQVHTQARRVHVGRGSISMSDGARLYDLIIDQDDASGLGSSAENCLQKYPTRPQAGVLVEEGVDGLRFWFEQWQEGEFEDRQAVNPTAALEAGWFGCKGSWRGCSDGGGAYDTRKNPERLGREEREKWDAAFS